MKETAMVALMLVFCASLGLAGDAGTTSGPGLSSWLRSLQHKLSQIVPKKSAPATTSVAGVRGAKADANAKLYWKGKKGEELVTEEETTKFKACLELAEKGDREAALKQLDSFMKQYPDSALIPDAKKTIDMVNAEPKTGPAMAEVNQGGAAPEQRSADTKGEQKP